MINRTTLARELNLSSPRHLRAHLESLTTTQLTSLLEMLDRTKPLSPKAYRLFRHLLWDRSQVNDPDAEALRRALKERGRWAVLRSKHSAASPIAVEVVVASPALDDRAA